MLGFQVTHVSRSACRPSATIIWLHTLSTISSCRFNQILNQFSDKHTIPITSNNIEIPMQHTTKHLQRLALHYMKISQHKSSIIFQRLHYVNELPYLWVVLSIKYITRSHLLFPLMKDYICNPIIRIILQDLFSSNLLISSQPVIRDMAYI